MTDYACEKCGSIYGAKYVSMRDYKARHLTAEQCEKYGIHPQSSFAAGPWVVHDTSRDESTYWGPFALYESALMWATSLEHEYEADGDEAWVEIESLLPVSEDELNG